SFYQRLTDNVGRLPGVQYAAISDSIPPDQESDDDTFQHRRAPVDAAGISQHHISEDQPRVLPRARRSPATRAVFTQRDTATSPPVTLISESLARRYFPDTDPIGQIIQASSPGNGNPYMEIIGVVGDLKYWGARKGVCTGLLHTVHPGFQRHRIFSSAISQTRGRTGAGDSA